MENWEKEIILNNIDKLASLTICSSELLSKFLANRILSETDVEELEGLGDNRIKQASQLYKIVSTRSNGFSSLLEFLEETNQSGAVAVLKGVKVKPDTLDELRSLKYDENSVLGTGSSGTIVYKGKLGDKDIAVKRLHLDIFKCDETPIDHEIKVLKACDEHEHIVRYLGSKKDHKCFLILLKLCDMNLKEWVADKRIEISPIEVLRQSTVGLDWLHQNKIVHRDFKPENILLSQKMNLVRVKISDFGLSRRIIDGKNYVCTLSNFGPHGWIAPEILLQLLEDGPGKFTVESDVFALGCVYYYVLTDGKHAFGDFIRRQGNILDDKSTLKHTEIKHGCVQNLQFVKLMISKEPTLRPTCSAILSYPIFWQDDRLVRFLEKKFDNEYYCDNGQDVMFEGLNCLETCMFHIKLEIKALRRMGCVIPTAFIRMQENPGTLKPCRYPSTELEQSDTNEALHINDIGPSVTYVPAESVTLNSMITSSSQNNQYSNAEVQLTHIFANPMYHVIQNPETAELSETMGLPNQMPESEKVLQEFKRVRKNDRVELLFETVKNYDFSTIVAVLEVAGKKLKLTDIWTKNQQSLLHIAVENREYDIVEYLVETIEFKNVLHEVKYQNDLIHACIKDINTVDSRRFMEISNIMQLLFKYRPELVDSKDTSYFTPLHIATFVLRHDRKFGFIKMLLQNNADCNAKNHHGETPLHGTAKCNHKPSQSKMLEIITLLLEHKADPDAVDLLGNTFLLLAAYNKNISANKFHELVVYLQSIGKTKVFHTANNYGSTVLSNFVQKHQPLKDTLAILKANGVDFNAVDINGDNVISRAIKGGRNTSCLKTLIRFGADWHTQNKYGDSVLCHSAFNANIPALNYFLKLGSNVNANNNDDDTALHAILKMKQQHKPKSAHAVIRELLNHGADPNVKNKEGHSPLYLAEELVRMNKLKPETVELMKQTN